MADTLLGIETNAAIQVRIADDRGFTLADTLLGIETLLSLRGERGIIGFTLADTLLGIETSALPYS